ncbi:NADH oxidase [Planctomycetes bacterium Pla163]|uniref:NADH oxidase n=1 Tax=Rohdeia mirabilis TaxID=2528008 RepID=A0A518CY76_9BACT|nr:NADH oxidase [Planctomycetes bacterium Pla163]
MSDRPRTKIHPLPDANWPSQDAARNSRLFSAVQLGPLELASRTWVPAMVPWRATDEGFATDAVVQWYARFAAGRPGAIVLEATGVRDVPSGPLLRIGHARFEEGLRRVVDAVREASGGATKVLVQLIDFLAIKRRVEATRFVERFLPVDDRLRERLAEYRGDPQLRSAEESAVRAAVLALDVDERRAVLPARVIEDLEMGYRERVTDTHLEHVRDLPRVLPGLFADAAERARRAGFDGVELHYAHAYTMASFLSARNDRDDGYGGSPDGRARLPLEVFAAVRERVGDDFCVGCRFLGDEVIAGGTGLDEAVEFGRRFAAVGMDFLSVSKGGKFEDAKQPKVGEAAYPYTGTSGHECMPTVRIDEPGPFGRNLPLSRAIRAAVRADGRTTPVVGAGGICTFEQAEAALANGDCDVVAAARQSLADPDWWLKMARGRGDAVRRCIFTNYCEGLDQRHKQVTCQLWDREFDEPDPDGAPARTSSDGKRRLVPPAWHA